MQQKTPLAQMSKRRLELTAEITHPLKSVPDTFYCLTPFTVPRGTRAIVEDSFQRRHTKQKRENRLQRLPLKFGIQAKSDNPNHWVAPFMTTLAKPTAPMMAAFVQATSTCGRDF